MGKFPTSAGKARTDEPKNSIRLTIHTCGQGGKKSGYSPREESDTYKAERSRVTDKPPTARRAGVREQRRE